MHPDIDNTFQSSYAIFIATFVLLVIWLFFKRPYDFYRDQFEVGYTSVDGTLLNTRNNTAKQNLINHLRRSRKIENMPPFYPNGWYALTESCNLRNNKTFEFSCLGLQLVAWRGASNKAYVADAYCPHLGAHLGIDGSVKGECIECPFHGWRFEGANGKCVHIPYSNRVPESAKIRMHTTLERNGFLFIWHHADNEKPTWYPKEFADITNNKLKYRGRSEFRISCLIQDIFENLADVNHFDAVHKPSFLAGGQAKSSFIKWNFITNKWTGSWYPNETLGYEHEAFLDLDTEIRVFDVNILGIKLFLQMQGPGIINVTFKIAGGEGVFFIMITPMAPLEARIVHNLYTAPILFQAAAQLFLIGESIMVERDMSIWNRKTYMSQPLLTKEDKLIRTFRRWYGQFYSRGSYEKTKTQKLF